jgi:hypothetical protein
MIPHRMPSNEIFANGLRGRVHACRRRLRCKRLALKSHAAAGVTDELEEVFPEPNFLTGILDDYPAGPEPLTRLKFSTAFAVTESSSNTRLAPVEEHEVGIT